MPKWFTKVQMPDGNQKSFPQEAAKCEITNGVVIFSDESGNIIRAYNKWIDLSRMTAEQEGREYKPQFKKRDDDNDVNF